MRVLIVALLALAVNAHEYGWNSWNSGSPSYSYGSGYGSSLYGASYGSGLGSGLGSGGITYVSGGGSGYGSGSSWGLGGGSGRSYYSSYTPVAVQTARYVHQEPISTGIEYKDEYYTNEGPKNKVVHTILGGTGYQTGGVSAVSSHQKWKSPVAVSRPAENFHRGTTSVHRSGAQGGTAPGKISFTQDFSGTSGLHRSDGITRVSSFKPAPAAVVTERHSHQRPYNTRTAYNSGYSSGAAPGSISFTLGGTGYQTGTPGASGYQKWKAPATVSRPAVISSHRTTSLRHGGVQGATAGVAPGKISFTQDFSGQSGLHRSWETSGVPALNKPIAPPRIVTEKHSTFATGGAGNLHKVGGHGATGDLSGIHYQEIAGIGGHTSGAEFAGAGYKKVSSPVVAPLPKRSHGVGSVHRSGTVSGQPQISFTQGLSKATGHSGIAAIKPEIHSYDRVVTPVRAAVAPKPFTGGRVGGTYKSRTQGFSAAAPAKISFTQDFSRGSGHQTPAVRPAVSTVSGYPGAVSTGSYQAPRRNVIYAPKPVSRVEFKAPKRPIVQEQALTSIYEQSPVQEAFTSTAGHVGGKSAFVSGPATGSVGDNFVDYRQEIVTLDGGCEADKQSRQFYVPGSQVVRDKSSAYKQLSAAADFGIGGQGNLGDLVTYKVSVPGNAAVNPTNTFVEEKVYYLSSGNADSAISSHDNSGLGGYSAISEPFKSFYSSSYPGYSQVSGESPRFDFSNDRNLLYTYNSPYMVSPFSYTYSSGKGQYDEVYKKA